MAAAVIRVSSPPIIGALYGGKEGRIWCQLFGEDGGSQLAEWSEGVASRRRRHRHRQRGDACAVPASAFAPGNYSLHVVGAAGHDIVKYALDTYGDTPDILSCTHDANSWPANLYAGLPAPREDAAVRPLGAEFASHSDPEGARLRSTGWVTSASSPSARRSRRFATRRLDRGRVVARRALAAADRNPFGQACRAPAL